MEKPLLEEIPVVTNWDEFRERWDSRTNFILRGEVFQPRFNPPPLQPVIAEVRRHENARFLHNQAPDSPVKGPYPEFLDMPLAETTNAEILLAHFDAAEFAGPGHVLEGLNADFDRWYGGLSDHGFAWTGTQRAFFLSGPRCHTGYHFDSSYVLVWQMVGVKRFCWLKDPERWCNREVRREYADHYERMFRPADITDDDVVTFDMHPGDILWNVMLTPHWVYALDEMTWSINITHFNLTCDGRLSEISRQWHEDRPGASADYQQKQALDAA